MRGISRFEISGSLQAIGLAVLTALAIPLHPWLPSASAEDAPPAPAPLPQSVPVLPNSREKPGGLLVNRASEVNFEDVLIAPLAAWLRDGRMVLRVVRNFETPFEFAPSWYDVSEKNRAEYELGPDYSLIRKSDEPAAPGWPFGVAQEVDREPDPIRRAYKILWNVDYSGSAAADLLAQVELTWVGAQAKLRAAGGFFYSRTSLSPPPPPSSKPPAVVKPSTPAAGQSPAPSPTAVAAASVDALAPLSGRFSQPGDILRRDGLRMFSPPVINGYARFSVRSRGLDEDRLWTVSPVLNRIREELPSNRTDGILGSSIAFDDLNVWSGKIQGVSARVVDQKVLLVPFPASSFHKLENLPVAEPPKPQGVVPEHRQSLPAAAGGDPAKKGEFAPAVKGFYQRSDGTNAMVMWNYETRQFAQFAPWVPTTVVFIPRRMEILEIESLDPYSSIGKSYLFIDQDLQLPIYKLVYDRAGEYRKTVIGGWGMAQSANGKIRFPFLSFLLVVDQSNQTVSTLTTTQIQTFLGRDTGRAAEVRAWFDADRYPKPKKEESEKVEPKKTPEPAAGDDEVQASTSSADEEDDEEEDEEEEEEEAPGRPAD